MSHSDQFKDRGLFQKYIVSKADGSVVDPQAEYFVLRLDYGGKDHTHVDACRAAIRAYAERIRDHLPKLAADIHRKYGFLLREINPQLLSDTLCAPYRPQGQVFNLGDRVRMARRKVGNDLLTYVTADGREWEGVVVQIRQTGNSYLYAVENARCATAPVVCTQEALELVNSVEQAAYDDQAVGSQYREACEILDGVLESLDILDHLLNATARNVVHGAFVGTEQRLRAFRGKNQQASK